MILSLNAASMHRFEYRYDEAFVRTALRRDVLWRGYLLAAMSAAGAIYLRVTEAGWNAISVALLALAPFFILLFHIKLRMMAKKVCELWRVQAPDGWIRFELDNDGFDVVLENARSRHEWRTLRRLWRYPDVWLIELVRMRSVFFPPDQVPEEIRDYVTERCESFGRTVKP